MLQRIMAGLERYFEFERLGTNWRTEVLAGTTTFVTMAYIIFVNPSILSEAGMPFQAVMAATCLCAAFGSMLMGIVARVPIALAPGMGLNAYFAYTVVKGMGIPWQTALGAVFLSGTVFLVLTVAGLRQMIAQAIPQQLYGAIAAGIGLFLAMAGLRNAGIIVPNASTTVRLGNLHDGNALLAIFGIAVIAALSVWRVRAALLLGIFAAVAVGAFTGIIRWTPQIYGASGLSSVAGKLDVPAAMRIGLLEIVFVFFFIDLFDTVGTLIGVTKRAGFMDATGGIPRIREILLCDAAATVAGSLAGTSTVTSYLESSAGIAAGGRSGVTAIVTGLLFGIALFFAPLTAAIPPSATAPALIVVGSLMLSHLGEIDWDDAAIAIPAFLTLITIPFTFSITNGLAFGFISYALMRIVKGEFRKTHWLVYVMAALFAARFVYLRAE